MKTLIQIATSTKFSNEADVETQAIAALKKAGYDITQRKCRDGKLNKHWPSKTKKAAGTGFPDVLLYLPGSDRPVCVWENKGPTENAKDALSEARFYIEGLRKALPSEPFLPRIAAGYNGTQLLLSYYNNDSKWVPIKENGLEVNDQFPIAPYLINGITAQGVFSATNGSATANDLKNLLPKLKTAYRIIPVLASGRTPIDFTIALLTLRMLVELNPTWGTWSEQPRFAAGSKSEDHGIGERLEVLAKRILGDATLRSRYGDIFEFHEKSDTLEIAFNFVEVLSKVEKGANHFETIFELVDSLPPLEGADFDIFGEVYQSIGDEATKKALGEFFTGRHIISSIIPVLFNRAGFDKSFSSIKNKKLADVACGTGGFLTEALRYTKSVHDLSKDKTASFAKNSFFGYDLGHANASRARVNMYFAGDGFSDLRGGFDSLASQNESAFPKGGFDAILTNPPYGKSSYGRAEEAFLEKTIDILKSGTGWGCIVLPTGVLENPRSAPARFNLLKNAVITDVIALPKHAFAPYTQQRTAIVIFNKRKSPVKVTALDWADLISKTAHEKVSLFVVDNDGYANSDKRYPTDRTDNSGQWLHDDLRFYIDDKGIRQPSKLHQALMLGISPMSATDEFGNPTGEKYGVFCVSELADQERGISLLPDSKLRGEKQSLDHTEWCNRVDNLIKFSQGKKVQLPCGFQDELNNLISLPVESSTHCNHSPNKISAIFEIKRGDQGLTEAEIYRSFDSSGLSVYGGGSGVPRFKVSKNIKNNKNVPATIFKGPAVVVSMDGSAGSVQLVEKNTEFCCNHHGRVLILKPAFNKLDLHWLIQQISHGLKRLASNKEGSATLTVPFLENFEIQIPENDSIIKEVGKRRKQLDSLAALYS